MLKWLCGGVVMCTTSGFVSPSSSLRSAKYLFIGNRFASCCAIRSSRSQTPTISHPRILPICDACESAILPHPAMATLSTRSPLSAAFEKTLQSLVCRNLRLPSYLGFEFLIAVARILPVGVPSSAVKSRRNLLLGPPGILLPQTAKRVAQEVRKIQRREVVNVPFIEAQETAARGQIIIDHVEHLTICSGLESEERNCLGAVIDICEWNPV